jgi:Short chain fatty acid transporter
MAESVANMIQPFFALPLLAIAGIPNASHDWCMVSFGGSLRVKPFNNVTLGSIVETLEM